MSCIDMLKSWGLKVSERKLSIQEVADAAAQGCLKEAFGTGTAAVISPIGHLKWGDDIMEINHGEIGPLSQKLYDTLTGIQWGKLKDEFGWTVEVNKCICGTERRHAEGFCLRSFSLPAGRFYEKADVYGASGIRRCTA